MKCIDPLVTGYERGTLEERSARTESSPRQSRKNAADDSRANTNIRETLGILSAPWTLKFNLFRRRIQLHTNFLRTLSSYPEVVVAKKGCKPLRLIAIISFG